jgi:DNA-directed RNA polymerase specialized sigma24 family protein
MTRGAVWDGRGLIERARRRDEDALEVIYEYLRPHLRNVVGKCLSTPRDFDVVLHDVVTRIFIYLPTFEPQPWVTGDENLDYLRRWATNLARNWTRNVNRYGVEQAREWMFPPDMRGWKRRTRVKFGRSIESMEAVASEDGEFADASERFDLAAEAQSHGRTVIGCG